MCLLRMEDMESTEQIKRKTRAKMYYDTYDEDNKGRSIAFRCAIDRWGRNQP
jgi:hypothetical protein